MGLIPAAQVQPHLVLSDFELLHVDEERDKFILSGCLDTVTVEQIIAEVGPRDPDFERSQKAFRLGTVVVSFAPLSPVELTYYDRQMALVGSDEDHDFAFAAATGYRATMDTRLDPPLTAVLDEGEDGLPAVALLAQNFPNPFNGGTVIEFALAQSGAVELTVYNLLGQQVAALVADWRAAGYYAVPWDGRDGRGRALASGTYLYRLDAGGRQATRKLSLLR